MTASKLVIVESPAKAKTIEGYLGSDYRVLASVGHIRDLPQPSELPADMKKGPYGRFAVDVEGDFDPYYVISPDKKKTVAELKRALKDADELYLATDEDREGEAIAWHLLQVLKPKVPVKRMVFHEITRDAIQNALANTRGINEHLVDAQETRRILDRLVGYEVSPLLWHKVRRGLSAGRVQSVATRMVVERERERMAFVPAKYWDLSVTLAPQAGAADAGHAFSAKLLEVAGQRIATGRDFDDNGKLKSQVLVLDEQAATALGKALEATGEFAVDRIDTKPYKRRPAAPFTTSTLQQEASRKLGLSSRETMQLAQALYENGYITYMRTDSTALSSQAINAARKQARELYGADSVPAKPRLYATKAKGAQEAHEAIRPAGDNFRTPQQVAGALQGRQLKLYDLIWKRTLASQMTDALGSTASVRINSAPMVDGVAKPVVFAAAGTVITQKGFLAAYEEGRDAERYDAKENAEKRLPELTAGEALDCTAVDYLDREHTTSPPPRYTEASLVKALEERSIGRPSTYAATIGVIIDRGYVERRGQALVPNWVAFSVTRLLEENLAELVDYDFTAAMEADLDRIADGEQDRVAWLRGFYLGSEAEAAAAARAGQAVSADSKPDGEVQHIGLKPLVDSLGEIDARATNSLPLVDGVVVRVGKFGPYLEKDDQTRANIPADIAPDELTPQKVAELFERAADDGRVLGTDPETGHEIIVKDGRFGPYFTEVLPEPAATEDEKPKKRAAKPKPRTGSLLRSMSMDSVTLEDALKVLHLPRLVGTDPESGAEIYAQNGKFGPYLTREKESRSLETEDQIFTVTLEEALALFAQPKTRGRRTAKPPLAEFGEDPVSGKKVVIKDGRFGPYITDGETNVTVPRGTAISDVTAERAYDLLAEKRAKGPAKKRTTRKTATRKTTTKKASTAKSTAKKTTTRKTAAK